MVEWKEHLERAVRLAGSQNRLAERMGCSQSKISWLLREAEKISADDAALVDAATGGKVSKEILRPDIFAPGAA